MQTLYLTIILLIFATLSLLPNGFAQGASPEYVVRLIYFLPNDRQPDPDINAKVDTMIKEAQTFFADQLEAHGFERKTFKFEADEDGNAVVHHVYGQNNDVHYQNQYWTAWNEIAEQFDMSKNIYFLALGISSETLGGHALGSGIGNSLRGRVLVPAANLVAANHELGHAFGLQHDLRVKAKRIFTLITPQDRMLASLCAAEWLDAHRYFNTNQEDFNENTTIQLHPPSLAKPPYTIRLRFTITDPDGLHQAQLLFPQRSNESTLAACQRLSGKDVTVEFLTDELVGVNEIKLRVMDRHGNFGDFWGHPFSIDITNLAPSPQDVAISIPDPNLASEVRNRLGVKPNVAITQLDMHKLKFAQFTNGQITDLTGLEHAIHLRYLDLSYQQIRDITPLAQLSKLDYLNLAGNPINNIAPLAGLTYLTDLSLAQTQINDITPLAELTNLRYLSIRDNKIDDITPVTGLTNLQHLYVFSNQINDITPLAGLTNLIHIALRFNDLRSLPDAFFTGLTALETLNLEGNPGSPFSFTVSLQKVVDGQFKAVAPAGAPFNIVLPLTVTNGRINGGATSLTIDTGRTESDTLTVTRRAGTTAPVTVNIGTLPNLPHNHSGYALVKSADLPLTVIDEVVVTNNAPVFTDGARTTRTIAENTAANTNIGTAITATDADNDRLTYTLGGTDAAAFSIDSTSGQLRTRAALDYETKSSYSVTIIVSDGNGRSDSITVTINVTDVNETIIHPPLSQRTPQVRDAIVRAVPGVNNAADVTEAHLAAITSLSIRNTNTTALRSDDFDGLTKLTALDMGSNDLSSLPEGIFNQLTALTRLVIEGNQLTTLPSDIFDGLTKLSWLDLGPNQFNTLPDDVFDGLTALSSLDLSSNRFTTLPEGIFDGLTELRTLALYANQFTTLPQGIFKNLSSLNLGLYSNRFTMVPDGLFSGLLSLTSLNLAHFVDPLPFTLSLQKVAEGQFKAVAPAGAPFDIVLPLTVANGSINGGATTVTIPTGSVESEVLTVTRTIGSTFAASVNIGTLPRLPANHGGYTLVKSADLPITVTEGDIPGTAVLTLTVGAGPGAALRGYHQSSSSEWDFGSFSPQTFELNGLSCTMYKLIYNVAGKRLELQVLNLSGGFELNLDTQQFTSVTARDHNVYIWYNVKLNWTAGQTVQVGFAEATPMPPDPPSNLQATSNDERVTLAWEPPANADPVALPITEYEFRMSADGGSTWNPNWDMIPGSRSGQENRLSYTIGDEDSYRRIRLTNGTEYTFEVRARGGDGRGKAARVTVIPGGSTLLSDRTPAVRDAIVAAVPDVNTAADVTEAHLAAITRLALGSQDITVLKEDDFDGLTNLIPILIEYFS